MNYLLALIVEEILLLFSLKSKRLHRKAGIRIAENAQAICSRFIQKSK